MAVHLPQLGQRLIGRDQDIARASMLVLDDDLHLLTFTGPGGIGKTRLALAVAQHIRGHFDADMVYVSLATLTDPVLVATTVAAALGIAEQAGQTLLDRLCTYLSPQQLLLVLDNFEHVLSAGWIIAELCRACPRLKVVVTSRSLLHVAGEHEFQVPPLMLPEHGHAGAGLANYAALQLFVERVQLVKPDWVLTAAAAPVVAAICARLDGLPLAIELAAARITLLSPQALLARLQPGEPRRLDLLGRGPRDVPVRQQTLRSTIAWSYDLLPAAEQQLFRRLAVFAGGATVAAVEAMCGVPAASTGSLPTPILDGLQTLLDNSLLTQMEQADGELRLVVLETIRAYALEALTASGEAPALQRAHAQYYLAVAEGAEPALVSAAQQTSLLHLEPEHDNFRAALHWSLGDGTVAHSAPVAGETALRLAGALWRFWLMRGSLSEGRRWLDRVLATTNVAETHLNRYRAKALLGSGMLALYQGDPHQAATFCGESLVLFRRLDDNGGIVAALDSLANVAMRGGNLPAAAAMYAECVALRRELGDRWGTAHTLIYQGLIAWQQGAYVAARPPLEEALALCRALDDRQGIAHALQALAWVALSLDDAATSRALWTESLLICRALHDPRGTARTLQGMATTGLKLGDYTATRANLAEAFTIFMEVGDKWFMAACVFTMASLAMAEGQPERAAHYFGAADVLKDASSGLMPAFQRAEYQRHIRAVRTVLGEETFLLQSAAGRAMTPAQILAGLQQAPSGVQQSVPMPTSNQARTRSYPAGLTAREVAVLCLVARGLTNAQIATNLIISHRTVNAHLSSIYSKLGFNSRAAATRFVIEHHLA
ncbi:MAG: hypothetical protein NVS2B7_00840 [Herpetosiphon sp.]